MTAGPSAVTVRRAAARQVLTALDKAERRYGFHHCDFRLENVMEHFPSKDHDASDELSIAVAGPLASRLYKRQFKMIDYGLAKCAPPCRPSVTGKYPPPPSPPGAGLPSRHNEAFGVAVA